MNYGSQNTVPSAPKELSLNDRLNGVSERMQSLCERIEGVLARVNGTPTAGRDSAMKVPHINPTIPLATVVEHLEGVQSRLAELTVGVERIA